MMKRYRIETTPVHDGYRFLVRHLDGTVRYEGWGITERAARDMAKRWIASQQPPGTAVRHA